MLSLNAEDALKIEKIRTITTKFSEHVLAEFGFKTNSCFLTCYPLTFHLENNFFSNAIESGLCYGRRHYWIRLKEYPYFIVDPTITQFHIPENQLVEDIELTYVGELINPPYDLNNYGMDHGINVNAGWKCYWKKRFLNNGFLLDDQFIPQAPALPPIESTLRICLKAAIIVIVDRERLIQQQKIAERESYMTYRNDIKDIICANVNRIPDLGLPRDFEDLLYILGIEY